MDKKTPLFGVISTIPFTKMTKLPKLSQAKTFSRSSSLYPRVPKVGQSGMQCDANEQDAQCFLSHHVQRDIATERGHLVLDVVAYVDTMALGRDKWRALRSSRSYLSWTCRGYSATEPIRKLPTRSFVRLADRKLSSLFRGCKTDDLPRIARGAFQYGNCMSLSSRLIATFLRILWTSLGLALGEMCRENLRFEHEIFLFSCQEKNYCFMKR